MKAPSLRLFLRSLIWAAVAGGAYWAGAMQFTAQQNQADAAAQDHAAKLAAVKAKRDPRAQLQQVLRQQAAASMQQASRADIIAKLIKEDPAKGLAELDKMPPGPQKLEMYREVFLRLGQDPEAAASAASLAAALPVGPERQVALQTMVNSWGRADPSAMLGWASQLPTADFSTFKTALLQVGANSAGATIAAQYLDKIPDAASRNQVITSIASGMSAQDPAGTLAFLNEAATGDTYGNNIKTLFTNLSTKDPATAATLLDQVPDATARRGMDYIIATNWGQSDPQAALAWAQTVQPPNTGGVTVNKVLGSWAASDPKAVLAYIQGAADPTPYLSAMPALAQSLATTDMQSALALVQSLPAGKAKSDALNSALVGAAQTDLSGTWQYALTLPDGADKDSALTNLVVNVGRKSLQQAAQLIPQMPAGPAQVDATSLVSASWLNSSPAGFENWLSGLPPGDVRDAAIVGYTSSNQSAKHPSTVYAEVNAISDPDLRATEIQVMLTNWMVKDPAAALKAANTANLPDDQRAALIQRLSKNQP